MDSRRHCLVAALRLKWTKRSPFFESSVLTMEVLLSGTLIFSHSSFARHEVPPGHAEHPGRYQAVEEALQADEFSDLERRDAPICEHEDVERVHGGAYREEIEGKAPQAGLAQLDADTFMGPSSLEAASRAAGGAVAAVRAVMDGAAKNAFVACRPPGHHAEPARAMGFCVFNNAAIAAMEARAAGAERVAVVDFDVHHGNGTQAAFWDDEDAFFASSHEWPQYPGTGAASERGAFDNVVNAPIAPGGDSHVFAKAWGDDLLPALADFAPDFIVVSAGFDAHRADPLGGLQLTEEDYAWITGELLSIARDTASGRLVSVLEGGYDLPALAASAAAHLRVLRDAPR
ncbi:MAG: histone deacetylase family protein [Pseudomonadota bacterium]